MQHLYLNRVTQLGFVLSILEIERLQAEEKDLSQSHKMHELAQIISQRMIQVHEIYANNMELLFWEEVEGEPAIEKHLSQRPLQYQNYYHWMAAINRDGSLSIEEKKQYIHLLCAYANSPEIGSESFVHALQSGKRALVKYFEGDNHPYKRLQHALSCYEQKRLDDLSCFTRSDCKNFMKKILQHKVMKYAIEDLQKMLKSFGQYSSEDEELADLLNVSTALGMSSKEIDFLKRMSERYTVFDIKKHRIYRGVPFGEHRNQHFLVVKNISNIDNSKDNIFIIGCMDSNNTAIYIGIEATSDELSRLLENKSFVAALYSEYDHSNFCQLYFNSQRKPLLVLIDDFHMCCICLQRILATEEIIIGDLYDDKTNNFFTVIFFRSKVHPEVVFVYPTIKILARRILHRFKLENLLLFPRTSGFSVLFNCFNDLTTIREVFKWLFSMFTNVIGEFPSQDDIPDRPSSDLVFEHLQTKHNPSPEHAKGHAELPNEQTIGRPFYAIMQYKDGRNTGNIHINQTHQPIFFCSRQQAVDHLLANFEPNGRVVGIDEVYWKTFRSIFNSPLNASILICLDAKSGEAVSVDSDSIDALIGMNEQELHENLIGLIDINGLQE